MLTLTTLQSLRAAGYPSLQNVADKDLQANEPSTDSLFAVVENSLVLLKQTQPGVWVSANTGEYEDQGTSFKEMLANTYMGVKTLPALLVNLSQDLT